MDNVNYVSHKKATFIKIYFTYISIKYQKTTNMREQNVAPSIHIKCKISPQILSNCTKNGGYFL